MNILDVIREETAGHLENAAVIDGDHQVSYRELFLSASSAVVH
jgi:hypothetical protein